MGARGGGAQSKRGKQSTNPPRGMRDFLPDQVRLRRRIIDVIRSVYEAHGFEPIETPALETLSVLLGKYGDEGDQLLFKVLKRGDKLAKALAAPHVDPAAVADLGLRYDLTVPLARVVAAHRMPLPFKRYQIQPVWRADRPARGRYREFYQCDVDIVGAPAPLPEVELLSAACQALERLGFDDFTVQLNHRGLLFGLLEQAGVPAARRTDAVVVLDKMDKIGKDAVRAELIERGVEAADALLGMLSFDDEGNEVVLAELAGHCRGNEQAESGLAEIEQILDLSGEQTSRRLSVAPCLARGLSYYTGAIFEISSPQLGVSLAGGGRYDGLIGMFMGEQQPACGLSLGLERIVDIFEQRTEARTPAVDVLVTCWDRDGVGTSLRVAEQLRATGLKVDFYCEPVKMGRQLKYASRRGIPAAVILGPDEVASGRATVKDLSNFEQQQVDLDALAATVTAITANIGADATS